MLVGLVTTRVTSAAAKAWFLARLSLTASLLVELGCAIAQGVTYNLGVALLTRSPRPSSVATHYGLWRPTGVTDKVHTVGRHQPD